MMFVRYQYPLPNNGFGYSFTEQELIELLDSVYDKGFTDGAQTATIQYKTTCAVSKEN